MGWGQPSLPLWIVAKLGELSLGPRHCRRWPPLSGLPGSQPAETPLALEARKVQEEEVRLDSISRSRGGTREPARGICPAQGGPQRPVTFCLRSRSTGWCLGTETNPQPELGTGKEGDGHLN